MADPMTALSIAAATVQFFDFGCTIVKLCKEIRNSAKNATEANAEIESFVVQLQEHQDRLNTSASTQGVSQEDVDTIENARRECDDIARKLLKILRNLKRKKRRWVGDVVWAAWRAYKAEGKIQLLERKLEGRKVRFREALTDVTRERVFRMLEEQNDLMQNTLLPEVRQMHIDNKDAHSITQKKLEEARPTAEQTSFLSKLSFAQMSQRHEKIEQPSPGTYEWIFTDGSHQPDDSSPQWVLRGKFMRWLISDQKVFWISGKAGSGKSSLMSFIENHERFPEGLKQWARGRPLTVLNFFFWRAGADLQKSIPGLLRSLLHQLLARKPVSDRRERLSKILNEVLNLYQRADECVFFLLDGLDEFEGSYSELLQGILTAELRSNTKICLSSRPVGYLQDRLQSYPSIRLEDLNSGDIEKFVTSKMVAVEYPYKDHMTTIRNRAQGIFLWAALLSKELIKGYKDEHYTESELQKILDDLPKELKALFHRFFSDINKHSRGFLSLVFQLLGCTGKYSLELATITACLHHNNVKTIHELLQKIPEVQRRIKLQSKRLLQVLEIPDIPDSLPGWALEDPSTQRPCQTALGDDVMQTWERLAGSTVDWLHRSAYDYIFNSPEAEVPVWVHETNIAQDVLDGCMWLIRYGLLIWETPPGRESLGQNVMTLTYLIIAQVHRNSSSVYQTLDNLCEFLNSSLFEGSWLELDIRARMGCSKEISCALIASLPVDFWVALAVRKFHDYILSRFHLVRRGPFAQAVCFRIFRIFDAFGTTPSLTRLVLDVLTEKIEIQTRDATPRTEKTHDHRFSRYPDRGSISWQSHGEYLERQMMDDMSSFASPRTMETLKGLEPVFSNEQLGQVPPTSTKSLVADVVMLLDHWQLFQNPNDRNAAQTPLKIHLSVSHACELTNTDVRSTSGTRIRLLGMSKRAHDYVKTTTGITPICVFHTSRVTNGTLSRFRVYEWKSKSLFKGALANLLDCREALIKDIREDLASQLDTLQQRYLLALVNIYFANHWEIEDWEEFYI